MKATMVLLAVTLAGCATWTPVGTPALSKQQALSKCEIEANGPLARLFYRDVLIGCMGREGWEQS